jgi:hypothetical protein
MSDQADQTVHSSEVATGDRVERPEFSPLPPDAPKEDRIGTAVLAMSAAAAAGVVWFSVLMIVVTRLRPDVAPQTIEQVDPNALYVNLAAYGTMVGVCFIGVCAWLLLAPIPSRYRRGALSLVTVLAGWCLAMGVTFVANTLAESAGLVAAAIAFAGAAFVLRRRAVQSANR